MRVGKIHFAGPLAVDRARDEPLWLQIVQQLEGAIRHEDLDQRATFPSSRRLARALGVSRNTVLTAYDELKARGLIAGHRGAGMRSAAVREPQYPTCWITVEDPDGNALQVIWN